MKPVGIDLGTTISLIATELDDGRVSVLTTRDGGPRLRSIVRVGSDGTSTVGEAAGRLAPIDPDSVFALFKRSMGKSWEVTASGRRWTPQDLSAEILRALLEDATPQLQGRPTDAVVTIPAYFGDDARRATREAAEQIGLRVTALLHEPTAACIACRSLIGTDGTVLVYDLGGGTFDVSVVQFHGDDADVLATAGDHRLGGKDWDDLIVDLVAELLESELGEDPRDDPGVLVELQERAREAKHALSRLEQTAVTIHAGGRIHRVEVDRRAFWGRAQALFDRTEDLVTRVLGDLGGASRVDDVLLTGGSTRMPPCMDIVERATGHTPLAGVDADEAVVTGAALFASRLRSDIGSSRALSGRIRDVTAHALGFVVVAADGKRYVNEVMIPRNAPLPSSATKRHSLDLPTSRAGGVLSVYMLQGEAERPLDTDALGRWTFNDIPGQPRSSVEVAVGYRYDEDGVVEVSASVDGHPLPPPVIDRDDRDLRWTEEDPSEEAVAEVVVALVIDVSVSMRGSKLEEAKAACLGFIDELDSAGLGDHLALVSFGSVARTIARVGDDPSSTRRAVKTLKIDGSTDLAAGLRAADAQLRPHDSRQVVVALTDGAPNDRAEALAVRNQLADRGFELIARGVAGADQAFLDELATGDGELVGAGELGGNFRGIARQLVTSTAARKL